MEDLKVIVTGGAGFIGQVLIKRLLEQKIPVLAIDNLDPFYSPSIKLNNIKQLQSLAFQLKVRFEFIKEDVRNITNPNFLLKDELINSDCIFHLAAQPGVAFSNQEPVTSINENIQSIAPLFLFAKQQNIKKIIFASSSSVYGATKNYPSCENDLNIHPLSPYAASKRGAEILCQTFSHLYKISVGIVRPFSVYGPGIRPDLAIYKFTDALFYQQPIKISGNGEIRRDFTYVEDLVEGLLAVFNWIKNTHGENICEIFNLGRGENFSLLEVIKIMAGIMNVPFSVVYTSEHGFDARTTLADTSKIKRILNFTPNTNFERGFKKFYKWYLEQKEQNLYSQKIA